MNVEQLTKIITDAILSEKFLTRENIENVIRTHIKLEEKRASRNRVRISEKKDLETMSDVIDLRYTLKLERDLAREELSKWKLKVQEILKNPERFTPESYSKISKRIKTTMRKVKEQKIRDAGHNLHRIKSSRAQDIKLTKRFS